MIEKEKIRVALFEDSYYPVIDGVVKVVHNYAALMNQISYCCVVCPRPGTPYPDELLPYDVLRTPSLTFSSWQYSVAVPGASRGTEVLKEKKPDILHVHSPFTQRALAVRMARKLQIPLVSTFHTKYYDDLYQITKSRAISKRVIANFVKFYNKCDSVWACSKGAARTLHEYGYEGEIIVMPNGTNYVRPENPQEVAEKAASRFGITKDKKNLLFVGTQVWQKNLRLILDTMKLITAKRDDIQLWIAGTGTEKDAIRQYAAQLGLTEAQTHFLGEVEEEEYVAGLYLNADLLFFPSVYDTSSIVLREASVMQIPALLTKGSNAADAVTADVSGFIAEENAEAMAAKIFSVIDDPELLRRVGVKASETIPIPWKELIPKVYDEYAKVIEAYRSR